MDEAILASKIEDTVKAKISNTKPQIKNVVFVELIDAVPITLKYNHEMGKIMLICNNINCPHHRDWSSDPAKPGFSNCCKTMDVFQFWLDNKIPIRMFSSIDYEGNVIGDVSDESKQCFIYEESTTSEW
jgi:hypothetical protein